MSHTFRTPSIALTFSESAPADKIQLFRVGSFSHPEYGSFDITAKLLEELKKNFDSKIRGIDLAIDYKHDNHDIAAGWIKELELADDALYAKVDWTPKGKQVISDKEFRYISPEFTFDYQDNESLKKFGATLLGAALTNRPVIKKMEPVIPLSEGKLADSKEKPKPKGDIKMDEKDKVIEALKAEIMELKSKLEMAEKDKKAYMEEKKMAEKEAVFTKMLSEGKVCAAQKDAWLKDDMVKFAELAQPLNLNSKGTETSKKDETEGKTVDEKIHKLAEEKLNKKAAKSYSDAVIMVLNEKPELAKEKYGERI